MTDIPSQPRRPSMFRRFIDGQVRLSNRFDELLPERYLVDGVEDFRANLIPAYLAPSLTIYDVGGGSCPSIDRATKARFGLRLIGLDIDAAELEAAPPELYDTTIVADITSFSGNEDADLIICQSTLEHVRDTASAFRAFSTTLKPNGRLLLFTPSRNAVFARINRILPERVKRKILFTIFPHKAEGQMASQPITIAVRPETFLPWQINMDSMSTWCKFISRAPICRSWRHSMSSGVCGS